MAAELSWNLVIFLAIVQGITEFLPISSSAHLLLPSLLFGLPDQGLLFDTSVHGGTLIGVIAYFRRDLSRMLRACFTPALKEERMLAGGLLLASIPVLAAGFFLSDFIAAQLRNLWVIGWTTLIFAFFLWWAMRKKGEQTAFSTRIILLAGLVQVLALVPGVSRAGIAITAGLWQGLNGAAAARLAFLLSIPVITAAFCYGIYQLINQGESQQLLQAILAALLAAIFSFLTIFFFLRAVAYVGMMPFIIYRALVGICLLSYLFFFSAV